MRRLIICADGTWNTADAKAPTNVVRLATSILPVDSHGVDQFVTYHRGVGTGNFLDKFAGGAFGEGLSANVKDVYRVLIYNFEPGDLLYFFGFSRGAYTVRSAAGLIRKCGLLRKEHADKLDAAYALYRRRDDTADAPDAVEFREQFAWPPLPIECIGVWDTVGALGIPLTGLHLIDRCAYQFHNVKLSRSVRHAYQAIAIDEHRVPFKPTLWEKQPTQGQIVEQVWFPGVHADIGGGYDDRALADITLLWMVEKAMCAGVEFDARYLERHVSPDCEGRLHRSMTPLYRLLGRYLRPIGVDPNHCESISGAAIERVEGEAPPYGPPNLMRYLSTVKTAV